MRCAAAAAAGLALAEDGPLDWGSLARSSECAASPAPPPRRRRITAAEALQHELWEADPRPGPNALMTGGRVMADYPERPCRPL